MLPQLWTSSRQGIPPCRAPPVPKSWQLRTTVRCAGKCVSTSWPHHSLPMLEQHLTTWAVYGPHPGQAEKGMMKILRKGFGGKPMECRGLQPCSGSTRLPAHCWDSWSPFAGVSSIDLNMVTPEGQHLNPSVTEMWRNFPDASKHLRELCPAAMDAQRLKCLLGTFGNLAH